MKTTTKKTRKAPQFVPSDWQKDPNTLKSDRVQFWTINGTMAGTIPLATAKEMVESGSVFCVCDQAVSQF